MLSDYLHSLGLSEKESRILLALAQLGIQPASVIARRANCDRVTTYKHLKKLAERGLVRTYFRDAVQCFGLEQFELIEAQLKERAAQAQRQLERFPTVVELLRSLGAGPGDVPELQMFEGEAGVRSLLRDLLQEAKRQCIGQVRVLTANTYEEHVQDPALQRAFNEAFRDLRAAGVTAQIFEATGGLVPERLRGMASAAASDCSYGTTNVIVAGDAVYLMSSRQSKIGLKVKQHDLSQIFHFLFDLVGRQGQ